jgi:WD40 repeat protein
MAAPTRRYEAFISYSHAGDSGFAAELQRALNRIARPSYKWWQWWPPRVFRDQTNLAAAADLSGEINDALGASDAFVLIASPRAAASHWVDQEAATWCTHKPSDRLFIALTDGALVWDDARSCFDGAATDALPPVLKQAFEHEPLWVDFTTVKNSDRLRRDPRFVDGAATLAAAIRGVDKDALIGDDLRQRRRTRQLIGGAVGLLGLLTLVAVTAAIYALVQRNRAEERARIANSRLLAARAVDLLDVDPEQSLALAVRAAQTHGTSESVDALRAALNRSRLRRVLYAGAPAFDAAVNPRVHLLAAGLAGGRVRVWSARTGAPVTTLRLGATPITSVSFSRDGRTVLAAGARAAGPGAAVWPTSSAGARPLATFDRSRPLTAALSPDGKVAATGDYDGVVRLWRTATGRELGQMRPPGAREPVSAIAFDAAGARLVAATGPRVTLWTLATRAPRVLESRGATVWALAFSPDGRRVAIGADHGVVRVVSTRGRRALNLRGHTDTVNGIDFSPDGASLVTASDDETARIWNLRAGSLTAVLRGHDGVVRSARFTSGGTSVVTAGADGTIRTWAVSADPVRARLVAPDGGKVTDVAFAPRGVRVAAASEDGVAMIWNLVDGRLLHTLRHGPETTGVESAQFSRDGRLVVTAGDDGAAKVWLASTGSLRETLTLPHEAELYAAAFSPDARLVAAAGRGGGVRLWRWRRGTVLRRLRLPSERIDGVAFSRSGALVAAAGGAAVRIWRVHSGTPVITLHSGERDGRLTSVAISRNGDYVASGSSSGAIFIWDASSGRRLARIVAAGATIGSVAFSADGRFLVSAAQDGRGDVWTVPGGRRVTEVRPGAGSLDAAAFAPHGRDIALAGTGGVVTVFDCAECRPLRGLVCLAAPRIAPAVRRRERIAVGECD